MANYVVVDPILGINTPVSATSTTQMFPLGLKVRALDQQSGSTNVGAGEFIYVRGAAAASAVSSVGAFCAIQGNTAYVMGTASSASRFPIGVAAGLLSASNVYGWVQVHGIVDYGRGNSDGIAAGLPLKMCATNGIVHTTGASANGQYIAGLVCPVSNDASLSTGSFTYQLHYPWNIGLSASL